MAATLIAPRNRPAGCPELKGTTTMKDNVDNDFGLLAEQIHRLVHSKELDRDQQVALYAMLLADVVGSVQCLECRQQVAEHLKENVVPHFIDQAIRAPLTGESSHIH